VFVCFFFRLVCLCCCVPRLPPPPALHNIYFICLWHDIAYNVLKSAVKHQASKQTNFKHIDILMEICLPLPTLFLCQTVGWDPRKLLPVPIVRCPSEYDRSMSNGLNAHTRSLKQIDRPLLHLIHCDSEKNEEKKTLRGDANTARWPDPRTTNTQTHKQTGAITIHCAA